MKHIKLIFLTFILSILFMIPGCVSVHNSAVLSASESANLNSDILMGPGECLLKRFQGTSANNKFYMNWTFTSNTNQFLFEVESSTDGKKFTHFGFKQGFSSPGSTELMLCMTDTVNKSGVVFYRIKAIPGSFSEKYKEEKEYQKILNSATIRVVKNQRTKNYMQDELFSSGTSYHAMK